jgi:glycyl-tRNA synthetase
MVTEMTSLQGIIGREYALRSGEPKEVAEAIGEQYQLVPHTKIGLAFALADRIDSLVGLFAVGLAPTGTKDPFGLRRAAIGIVQPLIEHDIQIDLRLMISAAATLLEPVVATGSEIQTQVLEFIAGRLKVVLNDQGYKYDVVDAVLAAQSNNPAGAARAVKQLQAWVERKDWTATLDAFARCARIVRSQTVDGRPLTVAPAKFVESEEKELYAAIQNIVNRQPSTVKEFLDIVVVLIPSITAFFDKVLVMAEDKTVKENRLGLLQKIAGLADGVADLSKLEGF